jgi:threonine synthase
MFPRGSKGTLLTFCALNKNATERFPRHSLVRRRVKFLSERRTTKHKTLKVQNLEYTVRITISNNKTAQQAFMKYTSTRDSSISCSFEEALCSGYCADGGLFVPKDLPSVDSSMLKEWSSLSFPELASKVIRMFISPEEISDSELVSVCEDSFVNGFVGSTVPVKKIGSSYIVELFHGPTFCFKDLGMRAVVNMLSLFATKRQKNITLVVSTTGDTGPAAVQAVADAGNRLMTLLVHFPKGQISAFQRKQLTTANSPYVHVVAFEGSGDDMDAPIKKILATSGLTSGNSSFVTGVNSYNIGRPLIQLVHFVWTYLRVAEKEGISPGDQTRPIDIILPTGAMGNIAGGYMAKKIGVPIRKLCAGVNINDITHRAIEKGEFHTSPRMEKTLSEAINIQVPYNFERLLFYLSDGNHDIVRDWMEDMEKTQKLDLKGEWLTKIQRDFSSARITDDEMCQAVRKVREQFNYFIDPNTAVAVAAAEKLNYSLDKVGVYPFAILSTASPCKFEESVTVALGEEGWTMYKESEFPARATEIESKEECEPTIYEWPNGLSLEEVQVKWECAARDLINEKFL